MIICDREVKVRIVISATIHCTIQGFFFIMLFILFRLYVINVKQILQKQLVNDDNMSSSKSGFCKVFTLMVYKKMFDILIRGV